MDKQYASSFEIKQIAIYKVGNESKPYANLAGDMCKTFQYFEDIFWPSYAANMVIQDSAENLISTMPIQGGEKVVVEVDDLTGTSGSNNGVYSYEFRVWNISNRISTIRNQTYTLGLISEEGLRNEAKTVNRIVEGNTSTQVKKILGEYLGVPDQKMDIEASASNIKILPMKKSPYTFIKSLLPRTLSDKAAVNIKKPDISKTKSDTNITDGPDSEAKTGTGTAGYLFFQTNRGHVFRSIDSLVSSTPSEYNGTPVQSGIFFYQPAKLSEPSLFRIQEVVFGGEFDMIKKLREGHYSSILCSFNINTLTYDEQVYNLAENWEKMAHLGSQTKLPEAQMTLSSIPTRVMSTIIDNEVHNNTSTIASVDDGGTGTHQYQDLQKHFLSQGLARAGILFNQQLTISVTGHLELCAGDKIEIRIPEQVSEAMKGESTYDPEHSGTYLIKQVNHQFNMTDGRKLDTVLDLVRDSQGIKDQESIVK